jgi:hypothetical protein
MSKTLCERQDLLDKHPERYMRLINAPRVVCRKCGRAANKKKYVCKPKPIPAALRLALDPKGLSHANDASLLDPDRRAAECLSDG